MNLYESILTHPRATGHHRECVQGILIPGWNIMSLQRQYLSTKRHSAPPRGDRHCGCVQGGSNFLVIVEYWWFSIYLQESGDIYTNPKGHHRECVQAYVQSARPGFQRVHFGPHFRLARLLEVIFIFGWLFCVIFSSGWGGTPGKLERTRDAAAHVCNAYRDRDPVRPKTTSVAGGLGAKLGAVGKTLRGSWKAQNMKVGI